MVISLGHRGELAQYEHGKLALYAVGKLALYHHGGLALYERCQWRLMSSDVCLT